MSDPDVTSTNYSVGGGYSGGGANRGSLNIALKDLGERKSSAQQVIARIRRQTGKCARRCVDHYSEPGHSRRRPG